MATFAATLITACSLGVLLHWWPRFGGPARWRLAIATNMTAIAFLIAAVRAEGLRETVLTSVVLVSPAYHTATASASASYYYYVLTAVCLLLGFAWLSLGEPLARRFSPRPLLNVVAVAWLVTFVRFLLEKSAAQATLAQAVGVTWMAPIAGVYLALTPSPRQGWRALLRPLVAYAFLVRGLVALVGVLATRLRLGTHYDVSALTLVPLALVGEVDSFAPASARQVLWLILVPQLLAWPAFTVVVGLIAGAIALRLRGFRRAPERQRASSANRIAAVDRDE